MSMLACTAPIPQPLPGLAPGRRRGRPYKVVPIRPLLDTRPSSAVVLRPMPTFDELMVLVKKVSRWFERRYGLPAGWSEDDMLQEGAVGLVRAIAKYDPTRPCALETYAGYWVRGSLWRALKERWTELNHEAPPPPDDLEGPWPSPETYCLYRETRDAILDELSLAEQVLVFGAADDEPLSSMARELGLSTSAVFRWHRRALKKVRAAVGARHDDVPPAG